MTKAELEGIAAIEAALDAAEAETAVIAMGNALTWEQFENTNVGYTGWSGFSNVSDDTCYQIITGSGRTQKDGLPFEVCCVSPEQDDCPFGLLTLAAAKVACVKHYQTRQWD